MNPQNSPSWGAGWQSPPQAQSPGTPGRRKWLKRIGIGALIFALGAGGGAAVTAKGDTESSAKAKPSPTVTATATVAPAAMTSQVESTLAAAEHVARKHGYTVSAHDASNQDAAPGDDWTVCFEQVTYHSVDFATVPGGAPCPKADGRPIPWPTMPAVVGRSYEKALEAVGKVTEGDVTLKAAYADEDVDDVSAEEGDYDTWKVCFQAPGPTTQVKNDPTVTLWLTEGACPAKKGTYKDRTNDPDYSPPVRDDDAPSSGSGSAGSGDTSTTCEIVSNAGNCYNAGQFCRAADVGRSTHAGNGRLIFCRDEGSVNRWNY
ncbi:PASTA domain-containing protein [Streptomyces sp. PA03-6a]|nr:PASTA domain-containing protein [Streptomyces sp. PA03-6a]